MCRRDPFVVGHSHSRPVCLHVGQHSLGWSSKDSVAGRQETDQLECQKGDREVCGGSSLSVLQNREPRNKPHTWSNDSLPGCQDHAGAKIFSTNGETGKRDIHMQKNEAGPLPYTLYKIKVDQGPKTIKLLEENVGHKLHDIGLDDFDMRPTAWTKDRLHLMEIFKICASKDMIYRVKSNPQNERKYCKLYI